MTLPQFTIMQTFYILIGIIAFGVGLIAFIKIRRTIGYKHLKYKLRRTDYADTVILLEGGGYDIDALPIVTEGKNLFLQDKNDKYGYSPIANGFAVIEENNALPIVRGGWIPKPIEKEAKKQTGIETTKTENLTEEETLGLFKWTVQANKLKTTLIRPLTRWSSRELEDAIRSKVIAELLDIPLKMIDVAILISVIGVLAITIFYGYQNNTLLQQIVTELAKDPYIPVP